MKISPVYRVSRNILFLIPVLFLMQGCYLRGKHPRMPDINPDMLQKVFFETNNILVIPLWRIYPRYYDETQNLLYRVSSPFIASNLISVSSGLKRPDYWSIVTPGSRIGNKFQMLRGIYLILNSGDVVWLSAGLGYETRWGYIKWATMCKEWQNELETAIETGKTLRRKEADYKFWGANYGDYMKIEVILTPDEKKMIKECLYSINCRNITNGGQWKLMFQ